MFGFSIHIQQYLLLLLQRIVSDYRDTFIKGVAQTQPKFELRSAAILPLYSEMDGQTQIHVASVPRHFSSDYRTQEKPTKEQYANQIRSLCNRLQQRPERSPVRRRNSWFDSRSSRDCSMLSASDQGIMETQSTSSTSQRTNDPGSHTSSDQRRIGAQNRSLSNQRAIEERCTSSSSDRIMDRYSESYSSEISTERTSFTGQISTERTSFSGQRMMDAGMPAPGQRITGGLTDAHSWSGSEQGIKETRNPSEKTLSYNYNMWQINEWQEPVVKDRNNKNKCVYYLDEEQPSNLEEFSYMVDGRSTDPRILPAVVATIRFLRQRYHRMLLDMKPKSKEFFEREFAKLERNRFYTKGYGNTQGSLDSWDESDSGTADSHDGQNYVKVSTDNHQSGCVNSVRGSDSSVSANGSCCSTLPAPRDRFSEPYALHAAASVGDTDRVMSLTLRGYDVNSLNNNRWPAVEMALRTYKFRCAIFLIEAGTNMMAYTEQRKREYRDVIIKARRHLQIVKTSL